VEEQRHALGAQITISVLRAPRGVYLRVGPEVTDPLDVDDDQLMTGTLEGEVAERLGKLNFISLYFYMFNAINK